RVYALRNKYTIAAANMSLGGCPDTGCFAAPCDNTDDMAIAMVKTAIDNLYSANIATVVATGNDGLQDRIAEPACISTAVSVGSTGDFISDDDVSSFSNSAYFVSLLAPGYYIYSSVPGGDFAYKSGTSQATPHVT